MQRDRNSAVKGIIRSPNNQEFDSFHEIRSYTSIISCLFEFTRCASLGPFPRRMSDNACYEYQFEENVMSLLQFRRFLGEGGVRLACIGGALGLSLG